MMISPAGFDLSASEEGEQGLHTKVRRCLPPGAGESVPNALSETAGCLIADLLFRLRTSSPVRHEQRR